MVDSAVIWVYRQAKITLIDMFEGSSEESYHATQKVQLSYHQLILISQQASYHSYGHR